MRALLRREEAFTLIEILVALLIFVVILLAFSALFINSYAGVRLGGDKTEQLYQAQYEMEQAIFDFRGEQQDRIDIAFPEITLTVDGRWITVQELYHDNRELSITLFLPGGQE